jgi:GntR family transcriptional regulator
VGTVRFDRDTRFCLAAAMDLALELGHSRVTPEHVLFGVAKVSPDSLPNPPSLDRLKVRLASLVEPSQERVRQVRYTRRTKAVLAAAAENAARKGRSVAGVEEVLGGLQALSAGPPESVELFREAGLTQQEEPADPVPDERVDASEYIFLTDLSDLAYYDQIALCVKEAVASGVLVPGDRLPPIRRLADLLDVAPGTVARAYRELEEARVVVTAGASGTRIALPLGTDRGGGRPPIQELAALLRPAVVAAYHLGGSLEDLFDALWVAAEGVFLEPDA